MDYYGVLGVGKDATKAEIKEAFRKLALKYHPDRHSGSSKSVHDDAVRRFKQVAEAYDVLNDDTKRAKYSNSYSSARSSYNTARASSSSAYYNNHNYNPYSNPNSYYYTKTSTRRHAYTDPRRYTYSAQYWQSVGGFNRLMAMIQLAATFTVFGCYIIADATGRGLWESANRGKSFEEAMYSLHKSKDSRTRMQNETDRAGS